MIVKISCHFLNRLRCDLAFAAKRILVKPRSVFGRERERGGGFLPLEITSRSISLIFSASFLIHKKRPSLALAGWILGQGLCYLYSLQLKIFNVNLEKEKYIMLSHDLL